MARNSNKGGNRILNDLSLNCSKRSVQRVLSSSKELKYEKLLPKPPLTLAHKTSRIAFAENHLKTRLIGTKSSFQMKRNLI